VCDSHGPPGLAWAFRQLELSTGNNEWRDWARRAALADRQSGIPEQREPGFWDNVARCCGSAGVAEFFSDLHRLEGHCLTGGSPVPTDVCLGDDGSASMAEMPQMAARLGLI